MQITRAVNSAFLAPVKFAILASFLLMLSGCWSIPKEVIPIEDGVTVPYTASESALQPKGKVYFSKVNGSNDYNFRIEGAGPTDYCGAECNGTLRAIHLQGDIYAVQEDVKAGPYNDKENYHIAFYSITPGLFTEVEPAGSIEDIVARAASFHVVKDDTTLEGSPSDIYNFIRGLKDMKFEPVR